MKEVLLQIYPEYEKDFYRFAKSHYIYCVYGFENEDMPKECKSLVEMLKLHIEQFCKKCQKVYVYGAGIYGRLLLKMSKTLQEKFGGWIETNSNCSIIDGFPIKSVKEMGCINNEDIGVLVAIKDKSIQKACLHAIGQWNVKKTCYDAPAESENERIDCRNALMQ